MRRPIRNYLLCFTIRYRRLLPSKKIGTLVGENSSFCSLAILAAIRRAPICEALPYRFQNALLVAQTTS